MKLRMEVSEVLIKQVILFSVLLLAVIGTLLHQAIMGKVLKGQIEATVVPLAEVIEVLKRQVTLVSMLPLEELGVSGKTGHQG